MIELSHVVKRYGKLKAVDDLSLEIKEGEVFGLLGPNGAGKTTTIEMIEGLRRSDGGTIRVAGLDPIRQGDQIKEIIGVQLDDVQVYSFLTVREILYHFGCYYRHHRTADEMIELMSLQEKANSWVRVLSRGQRQRLGLGLALINDPRIIFLDEPTSGLDPQGRQNIWDIIGRERSGKTVLLTTHYMEEAETICDRIGIVDHGKLIALGTPAELIAEHNSESRIEFNLPAGISPALLEGIANVKRVATHNGHIIIHTDDSFATLREMTHVLGSDSRAISYLTVRRGSLEDVFLKLTGRSLRG